MARAAKEPSQRRYSIAQLALLVPVVALIIDAWAPIRDNSFLWHIRAGELQINATRVLEADPFSFTMLGTPWLTQSWLAELLYAAGENFSKLGFVPPMLLIVSLVTFACIGLIAFRYSRSVPATAVVMFLSTLLLLSFLVPRPVIFSYALFALVILAWSRPSTRWALPLLFWIWASVHGSFVIGLAYVVLSIVVEKAWRWLPIVLASGLATLVTAHGLGVLRMLVDFADARETLALLSEWRRPETLSVVFTPFLIGVVIIIYGSLRRRFDLRQLWLIVPFLLLGFGSTRAVPPAWFALIPTVAVSLGPVRVGDEKRFLAPIAALVGLFILVFPIFLIDSGELDTERFPVEAAVWLDDVNTFHDDRVGGYLIWLQGPEQLVYLDDRAELYGERMAEFVAIRNGETAWEPIFRRDDIRQAILRVDEDLVDDLSGAGWTIVHMDDAYVVLR